MLIVSHRIQIGSDSWESAENSRLISLRAEAAFHVPVNSCKFTMTHPDGINANVGDDVNIELGHGDELEKIFTGHITQVNWSLDRVHICAQSSFRSLVQKHINAYFDEPSAADIVNALASEANISTGSVDTGLSFSHYTVGDQVSMYDHLKILALQCGVDLYADEEDKLVFANPLSFQPHDFQFGVNLLKLTVNKSEAIITKVEVLGESPASHGQGADASFWLTKTDVPGSAGSSENVTRYISDPTARTTESAGSMAENYHQFYSTRYAGQLLTIGNPELKLGEEIKISQMPVSAQNGHFKMIGLQHRIHPKKGFLTYIDFAEIP